MEELGRCDCPKHLDGPDCSSVLTDEALKVRCDAALYGDVKICQADASCLNRCNNLGQCIQGFCHCEPGYYGTDCSLSLGPDGKPVLLAGTGYKPRAKRPWVYVYELPPHLSSWLNNVRMDRPTHYMFWQRLLSSGARVADPEQADWFFIPIRQRGGHKEVPLMQQVLTYVQQTWPYWNKTHGHKHFMIATGDVGVQELFLEPELFNITANVTWLSHWGLHKDHAFATWKAAHRPGKDIVIPVFSSLGTYLRFGMERSPHHPAFDYEHAVDNPRFDSSAVVRDKTMYFAGRICGHRKAPDNRKAWPRNCGDEPDYYSGGVRQAVHYYHHNRTGWRLVLHDWPHEYKRNLLAYKFCLAPLGGGHGQRQIIVAFQGCIPVTIGDNVYQPFEPELDWTQFSVQVPESKVPELHTILAAIKPNQLARMQRSLRCAAQHFAWSSIVGGFMLESGKYDAFETILEILRMKTLHPDAKPQEYAQLDADFKRFMACGADSLDQDTREEDAASERLLCTSSALDEDSQECMRCWSKASKAHGIPGGVICCKDSKTLSQCPRLWP